MHIKLPQRRRKHLSQPRTCGSQGSFAQREILNGGSKFAGGTLASRLHKQRNKPALCAARKRVVISRKLGKCFLRAYNVACRKQTDDCARNKLARSVPSQAVGDELGPDGFKVLSRRDIVFQQSAHERLLFQKRAHGPVVAAGNALGERRCARELRTRLAQVACTLPSRSKFVAELGRFVEGACLRIAIRGPDNQLVGLLAAFHAKGGGFRGAECRTTELKAGRVQQLRFLCRIASFCAAEVGRALQAFGRFCRKRRCRQPVRRIDKAMNGVLHADLTSDEAVGRHVLARVGFGLHDQHLRAHVCLRVHFGGRDAHFSWFVFW